MYNVIFFGGWGDKKNHVQLKKETMFLYNVKTYLQKQKK